MPPVVDAGVYAGVGVGIGVGVGVGVVDAAAAAAAAAVGEVISSMAIHRGHQGQVHTAMRCLARQDYL
jgi:hypothetical protein